MTRRTKALLGTGLLALVGVGVTGRWFTPPKAITLTFAGYETERPRAVVGFRAGAALYEVK